MSKSMPRTGVTCTGARIESLASCLARLLACMAESPDVHHMLTESQQELSETDQDESFGRVNFKVPARSESTGWPLQRRAFSGVSDKMYKCGKLTHPNAACKDDQHLIYGPFWLLTVVPIRTIHPHFYITLPDQPASAHHWTLSSKDLAHQGNLSHTTPCPAFKTTPPRPGFKLQSTLKQSGTFPATQLCQPISQSFQSQQVLRKYTFLSSNALESAHALRCSLRTQCTLLHVRDMSSDGVISQRHMGLHSPADETACPAAAGLHIGNVCAWLFSRDDCEGVPLQAGHCTSSDEQLLQSM